MKIEGKAAEKIKVTDCITISDYVAKLIERTSNDKISNGTIHYQLEKTNNLDWVEISGIKLIVNNDKAKVFTPGTNYGHTTTRTMKKIQL